MSTLHVHNTFELSHQRLYSRLLSLSNRKGKVTSGVTSGASVGKALQKIGNTCINVKNFFLYIQMIIYKKTKLLAYFW